MSFREIVGHRRVKRLLARAVQSGTLPPSLVFAGPDGVGKRQLAYALAQALNCPAPLQTSADQRDGCGTCPSCSLSVDGRSTRHDRGGSGAQCDDGQQRRAERQKQD